MLHAHTFRFAHLREVRLQSGNRKFSIHAPAQGATFQLLDGFILFTFRFTHPREFAHLCRARPCARGGHRVVVVSIRAPAQGATAAAHQRKSHLPPDFDSRTCVRCDVKYNYFLGRVLLFRFAHLREVRHHDPGSRFRFDSRTREGCDCHHNHQRYAQVILTHAPVWARLLACYRSAWRVLIRAPVQGATRGAISSWTDNSDFDSRTHAGCDSIYRATRQLKAQHVCFDNTILLLDCIDISQDKREETSAFRFTVPSHSELRW